MKNIYKKNLIVTFALLALFIPAQSSAEQLHYLTNSRGEIVLGAGALNDLIVVNNGNLLMGTECGLFTLNPNEFSIERIALKDRNVKKITLACQGEFAAVQLEDAINATCLLNWDTGEIIREWVGDSIECLFSKDGNHSLISGLANDTAEILDVQSLDSIVLNAENVIQYVNLDTENHLVSWIEGEKIVTGDDYEIKNIHIVTWNYLENEQDNSVLLKGARIYWHPDYNHGYWESIDLLVFPNKFFESEILGVSYYGCKYGEGGSLCCWNKMTGEKIELNTDLGFSIWDSLRISCDGQWLIVNNGGVGSIDIGNLTGSVLDYSVGPYLNFNKIAINPKTNDLFLVGTLLMDNVYIHGIYQYQSSDNTYPSTLLILKNTPIEERSAAFSPQNRLAVLQYNTIVDEYDLFESAKRGEFVLSLSPIGLDFLGSVSYSRDGSKFVRGYGNKASLWTPSSMSTGRFVQSSTSDRRTHATFDRSGERFLTASGVRDAPGVDNLIRIWDAETFEMLRDIHGHSDSVWYAEFSPDDRRIVSASLDGTAKVWDVESGALIASFVGHASGVEYAAFFPDGDRILSADRDRKAYVWNAETAEIDRTFDCIHLPAQLSPDGKHLFAGSEVWNVETDERIKTLDGRRPRLLVPNPLPGWDVIINQRIRRLHQSMERTRAYLETCGDLGLFGA